MRTSMPSRTSSSEMIDRTSPSRAARGSFLLDGHFRGRFFHFFEVFQRETAILSTRVFGDISVSYAVTITIPPDRLSYASISISSSTQTLTKNGTLTDRSTSRPALAITQGAEFLVASPPDRLEPTSESRIYPRIAHARVDGRTRGSIVVQEKSGTVSDLSQRQK